MIKAIGTDIVAIARFADWHTRNPRSLERLLSTQEIAYCLSTKALSAERFAVRFAAREALFKALCAIPELPSVPFLTVCKNMQVVYTLGSSAPTIIVDWAQLYPQSSPETWQNLQVHGSLSHGAGAAVAMVVVEAAKKGL